MEWWNADERNRKSKYQAYEVSDGYRGKSPDDNTCVTVFPTGNVKTFKSKEKLDSFLKENSYEKIKGKVAV